MRYVIYGAGAVGGAIGGRLFESGADVTLVARGAHLDVLRDRGLTLASGGGTVTLPVPVVGHPAEAGLAPGDVVVLAMKSQGTAAAVSALAECAPRDIRIACAQNGVENERVALRSFAGVYAVYVLLPAIHLAPGEVVASAWPVTGVLDVGRYPGGVDGVAEEMAGELAAATFASVASPDVMRWKYAKLLDNLFNAIEAVCGAVPPRRGSDPGGVESPGAAEHAALAELGRRVRAEGVACLAAAGVDVATRDEVRSRRAARAAPPPAADLPTHHSSTWQSLASGAGTVETDYLTGEVVLLGRLHGVPTPANALLQALANQAAAGGRPPGSTTAVEVLAVLDRT
jgi:2-dehydropantoate 2-reductase